MAVVVEPSSTFNQYITVSSPFGKIFADFVFDKWENGRKISTSLVLKKQSLGLIRTVTGIVMLNGSFMLSKIWVVKSLSLLHKWSLQKPPNFLIDPFVFQS